MPISLNLVAEGAKGYIAEIALTELESSVFFVCSSDFAAKQMYSHFPFENRIYLPSQQTEIGIIETKGNAVLSERAKALINMQKKRCVVFLSIDTFLYKMCPHDRFYSSAFSIKTGDTFAPQQLLAKFVSMGYERSALIDTNGQISGRGEIVEVYPPDYDNPVRITFFDDEIESMRFFDEETQRSFGENLQDCIIYPAHEFVFSDGDRAVVCNYLKKRNEGSCRAVGERFAYELEEYSYFPNIEAFTGLLEKSETIADYLSQSVVLTDSLTAIISEHRNRAESRNAMLAAVLSENGAFGCENTCYSDIDVSISAIEDKIIDFAGIEPYRFSTRPQSLSMDIYNSESFHGSFSMLKESLLAREKAGWKIFMFAGGRAKSLSRLLMDEGMEVPVLNIDSENEASVGIFSSVLYNGFELRKEKTLFLSEEDIFGVRRGHIKKEKRKKNTDDILSELNVGDIVVHDLHGKGRFLGIKNMEVGGVCADYIELEYRDGDKLYIQTSQIDRVQKYIGPGSDEENAKLSKLGGKEWDNQKSKARKSIKKLAEDLQKIYSERAHLKGYRFSEDTVWQREFEENFDHDETPGQIESIRQIKRDMQSSKIMDRLLLGDVGYGKTEVAMRACFKAVMDSKQVAVLVPTTLLARQHFITFKERFAGFPIKIVMLSRFTDHPAKVIEQLKNGGADIVIGTHKLLSKSIEYKNLGLLIVDEEQRFGVSHKERIKDMKRTVDVLTLTATPIPRTLEMALTGIRDMSTIDTPPPDRKEVQAYVTEFSGSLVREAVMKELARGGQIFFVCPRVAQMDELMRMLKQTVPEARCCSVHGQMNERDFENTVSQFIDHEYDLMLCTTIIESGIDIPAANTIIVYQSEMFGLAQLYQLKGRVGRSSVRAYAYFTHLGGGQLSELAAKRLAALREFTQFGSGLKIAMKDLEIRGAGNILGAEQSGHMAQIGYSLYCKLVREEVASLNAKQVEDTETTVEFGVSAFIPASYVSDEGQKIDMYRRIAAINTLEEAKDVRAEFSDRFGAVPKEVENLLTISVLKAFAQKACIASVIRKNGAVEMKLEENASADLRQLSRILDRYKNNALMRRSTPPVIVFKTKKGVSFSNLLTFVSEIGRCIYKSNNV